jgi:hypothetical protein
MYYYVLLCIIYCWYRYVRIMSIMYHVLCIMYYVLYTINYYVLLLLYYNYICIIILTF